MDRNPNVIRTCHLSVGSWKDLTTKEWHPFVLFILYMKLFLSCLIYFYTCICLDMYLWVIHENKIRYTLWNENIYCNNT